MEPNFDRIALQIYRTHLRNYFVCLFWGRWIGLYCFFFFFDWYSCWSWSYSIFQHSVHLALRYAYWVHFWYLWQSCFGNLQCWKVKIILLSSAISAFRFSSFSHHFTYQSVFLNSPIYFASFAPWWALRFPLWPPATRASWQNQMIYRCFCWDFERYVVWFGLLFGTFRP